MRVLVCGGRDYQNEGRVGAFLDRLHAENPISLIIEGGQRTWNDETNRIIGGADYWAYCWAHQRGVLCRTEKADWRKLGRRAGPIRNQLMIDKYHPELVVAFPGGRGTDDMISRAEKASIEICRPSQEK